MPSRSGWWKREIFYASASGVENPVIYVGSKTGRDGIHGATMASEEFSEGSEAKRPNVQVGDPFMEKLLLEACLEAMQTGHRGHSGHGRCRAYLLHLRDGRARRRGTGDRARPCTAARDRHERLRDHAQRVTGAHAAGGEEGREEEVFRIFRKWGLDGVTIGRVIGENTMRVLHHGEVVAEIPNQALTDEAPVYHRPVERWEPPVPREKPEALELGEQADFTDEFRKLLASPNICSKRWVYEQYDSMVQTNTVQGPGGRRRDPHQGNATARLAMALDGNGRWCYLDPKLGAMHAVAEAARKVACTGANRRCHELPELRKPGKAAHHGAVLPGHRRPDQGLHELGTPITGGNVSFYNETLGEAVYPTPVVGVVGILADASLAVGPHAKGPGRRLFCLRRHRRRDSREEQLEFGSSEYALHVLGELWGEPPLLNLKDEKALQNALAGARRPPPGRFGARHCRGRNRRGNGRDVLSHAGWAPSWT